MAQTDWSLSKRKRKLYSEGCTISLLRDLCEEEDKEKKNKTLKLRRKWTKR